MHQFIKPINKDMYIVIQKEPLKVITFETKTDLANYIGVHRNTINYQFSLNQSWESKKGIVYQSNKHYKAKKGGNKDSLVTKKAKANGEIECKTK